jgi:hypothetical protein
MPRALDHPRYIFCLELNAEIVTFFLLAISAWLGQKKNVPGTHPFTARNALTVGWSNRFIANQW